jgi:GT2 family glycosyltransferase
MKLKEQHLPTLNIRLLPLEPSHARPWFYFDQTAYVAECIKLGVSPPLGNTQSFLDHYLERGSKLGLSPNPLFDEDFYCRQHSNVAREIEMGRWTCGFEHFLHIGAMDDLSPTWFFNGVFYRNTNGDLTAESLRFGGFLDSYAHYLHVGITERRAGHWLIQALKTIKPTYEFPLDKENLVALLVDGKRWAEIFKNVLDYGWMKEKYLWGSAVQPSTFIRHYLLHVKTSLLSPSPYFDEPYYLANDAEINGAVAGGTFASGYEHFVLHGMNEWRRPFAGFDPIYYFQKNMVSASDRVGFAMSQSPFTHFLRNRGTRRLPISPPLADADIPEEMGKGLYERRCAINAAKIGDLAFTPPGVIPDVSVLIIARDNFEQTANCIVSAAYSTRANLEVIVFDNGSTDDISKLPLINPHIKYLRAETNLGFTIAVNRAAELATGRIVLLFNNDAELAPGAIDRAVAALEADLTIGAIGGKVIRMHGRLQEGGSIIWRDGTCLGYGRDKDPADGQVNFQQDVDFCSGCFLALRTDYWRELGGLDEAYAPAYYEETDLCVRIWEDGKRVVYDPRIIIWHFEYGTSSIREEPLALMRRNQRYFVRKHERFLSNCLPPAVGNIERARLRHVEQPRILFLEDKLPKPEHGMGFVRSDAISRVLAREAGLLSMAGLHNTSWDARPGVERPGQTIETLTKINVDNIERFFQDRIGVYDVLWLCRTHNLPRLRAWRAACPAFFEGLQIVLDTEAIASARRHGYAQQVGQSANLEEMLFEELEYLDGISHICAVNELDRLMLVDMLDQRRLNVPVSVLGHSIQRKPTVPRFDEAVDIVIAGAFSQPDGPNADGLLWFDEYVRPLLSDMSEFQFVIAGSNAAQFAAAARLKHAYKIVSDPVDMGGVYQKARLMVAPTRFAAGIPMKVHEAASYGVPVAMTDLLARQLGWSTRGIASATTDPLELAGLVKTLASNRIAWDIAQRTQLSLVEKDCDPADFEARIRRIVGDLGKPPAVQPPTSIQRKTGTLTYAN